MTPVTIRHHTATIPVTIPLIPPIEVTGLAPMAGRHARRLKEAAARWRPGHCLKISIVNWRSQCWMSTK